MNKSKYTKYLNQLLLLTLSISTRNGLGMGATNPSSPRCPRIITMESIKEAGHCRIMSPGTYELGSDISYEKESDSPIIIASDNVTLNLKGYKIIGIINTEKGLKSKATAIQAIGRSNILVNGLRSMEAENSQVVKSEVSGFFTAVNIQGGKRNFVKGLFVRMGYFYGIRLGSEESTVSDNVIAPLVGTQTDPKLIMPVAIQVGGKSATVNDNSIAFRKESDIKGYYGVTLVNAPSSTVSRNNFNSLASADPYNSPKTIAIMTDSNIENAKTLADANNINGFVLGIYAMGKSKIQVSNNNMSNVFYPYAGNIVVVSDSN